MSAKVLICDPVADETISMLEDEGFDIEIKVDMNPEELESEVPEYQAMVVRSATKVREKVIDKAKNLEVIVRAGVGLDNIDVDYAEEKGVKVLNTPEASSRSVAELAIAHMLCLARNIPYGTASLKDGKWEKKQLRGIELAEKTLGLIGIGRIGKRVAKRAKCMGMEVIAYYYKPIEKPPIPEINEMVSKDELLKRSDFITLHIPYDPKKGPEIGKEELDKVKDGVYIVNCARGGVVDEGALLEALESGKVAGAGIDVFIDEPPGKSRLIEHPNVSLTPHLGATTYESQRRVGTQTAEKLIEFFSG